MALTRKMLKGMGLTDEQVDAIIEGHTESLNAVKPQPQSEPKPKDKGKSEANTSNEDEWKTKYEQLVAENAAKETRSNKEKALKALLDSEESKFSDKGKSRILKYADFDSIELDSSGNVKGGKKLLNDLAEEWSEYVTTTETQGTETHGKDGAGSAGGNASGGTKMTREEILKITDSAARQKAIMDNPDAFRA